MIKLTKEESKTYYYDEDLGERPIIFIETLCRHFKGSLRGELIELVDFHKYELRSIFGVRVIETKERRYQEAYLQVAKKNAKTTVWAAVMVYLLFGEKFQDEIIFAAASKDQAKLAFEAAKFMVLKEPRLKAISTITRDAIINQRTGGGMKVIASDADFADGMNPSAAIVDELHRHKKRDLYDVITASGATRESPLVINITTAGAGQDGIGWELYQRSKRVASGIVKEASLFVDIYEAKDLENPFSIESLEDANPGIDVIVKREFLLKQAKIAKNTPSFYNQYVRFHLNRWTSSHNEWVEDILYQKCNKGVLDKSILLNHLCYTGTDLASNRDLSSTALFFPAEEGSNKHKVIMKYWCPDAQVGTRSTDHIDYSSWVKMGYITPCGGNAQDHDVIVKDIKEISELYDVQLSGFDKAKSIGVVPKLIEEGMEFEPISQSTLGLSEPMKYLEKLILDGDIEFYGDPVLRWQFNNVMVKIDANENIYPNKEKSKDKIDGVVALIMAIAVWQIDGSPLRKKNMYKKRGFRTL